jgi:DNA polymerase alpha subunit A
LAARVQETEYDDFDDSYDLGDSSWAETEIKQEVKPIIKIEPEDSNPFQVDEDDYSPLTVKEINVKGSKAPMALVNDSSKKEKATVVKQPERDSRQNWMAVDNNLNQSSETKMEPDTILDVQESNIKEEDGTLRMYWIDACEVRGVVYLFGKVGNGHQRDRLEQTATCTLWRQDANTSH